MKAGRPRGSLVRQAAADLDGVGARWAIIGGLARRVTPAVAGPGNVEPVTDLGKARANIGFAAFSAVTHSRAGSVREILEVLAGALGGIGTKNGAFLAELVEAGLDGTSSYEVWRDLMITNDYPHVSQWRAQATAQGIEQGSVKTRVAEILRILARRNVSVSEDERTLIEGCTDMATLEMWFDQALVIDDINDLFAR